MDNCTCNENSCTKCGGSCEVASSLVDCSKQRQKGYIRRNPTSEACLNQLDYYHIPPSLIFTSLTNYSVKTYPQPMTGSIPPVFIPFPIPIYTPPIPIPTPVVWEDYSEISGNIHDYAHYTTDKPNTQSILVDGTKVILRATGRFDIHVNMTNLLPAWFITSMSPIPLPDFVNYQVMLVEINDVGLSIIPPFVTNLNITTEQSAVNIKTNFIMDVDDELTLRVWLITFLPNLWITKINITKISEMGGSTLQYSKIFRPRGK
jgi:hypothetical protein